MLNPEELPDIPIDFRPFARRLLQTPDLKQELRNTLEAEVTARAVTFGGEALPPPISKHRSDPHWIDLGIEVAKKAVQNPDHTFSAEENAALEAVVRLQNRPALLIQRDSFSLPPSQWERLEQFRSDICNALPSVGRIDSNPGEMLGTGFLVAEDLVMTNRHVVRAFADPPPSETGHWKISAGKRPQIDFKMEYDQTERRVFAITGVTAVHSLFDLALLRVSRHAIEPAGELLTKPIRMAGQLPAIDKPLDLYAVGYPWTDNEQVTPPEVLKEIFREIFKVKRLQPGEFKALFDEYGAFSHDCSTLGGNSGSLIVDLASSNVIGLHFKGKYRSSNYAVSLWKLKDDPLFRGLGLNFEA